MLRLFSRLLLTLLLVATLHAQSVRWEPSSGTLALNQLSELSLIFDQCDPKGTVTLPPVNGLTFGTPSRSDQSSFNIINGSASHSSTVTLTYRVRPATQQTITIPDFDVATDKGRKHVAAATFEIGAASVGQSNLSLDAVARSAFTLSDSVWAGEVFPLKYTLNASKRYLYNLNKDFDWVSTPLSIEAWSSPDQIEAVLNEETRVSVIYKTRATIKTPGQVTLNPATHLVNITTGSSPFGMFSRPNLEQFAITTKPTTLTVRPLPSPAPGGFTGAVGQFTLDSTVVPATASVGEPITWTLTLAGTGNWPDLSGLPVRSVSKDFRVVQPQAKRTPKDNSLFDASLTEDIVLIPTKPGPYTLGPVTFSYFDPKTGSYQTITTAPVTINVTPGAINTQPSTTSAQPSTPAAAGNSSQPPPPVVSPQLPTSIPRDPLPPTSSAAAPLPASTLHLALISCVACPLFAWIWLALRRARSTDPRLPQRMARLRLASTLNALRNTTDTAQITALLQQWQCDTALLWQIATAVPTAAQFPSEDWAELWTESERVLYRAGTNLPHDWISHAQQSLAAKRVPSFSVFQLFLPRNLLPCLIALFVSAFVLLPSSFATDGRSAYTKGDFTTAAATWQDALKANPLDWSAHHDLSLTLVQQNQWNQAAGHALAAFVQRPDNASVRWHLGFALKGAGIRPAEVAPFIEPDALHSLALMASPSCWQFTLIASAWIAALSLGLWFWSAYGGPRWFKFTAWSLLVITALFAATAGTSLHLYGTLADNRAVFVTKSTTLRSIPTELDTPQKSAPLTVGVIAVTDKTFLGWKRLAFPNGQTGWVRSEDLVALWKTP